MLHQTIFDFCWANPVARAGDDIIIAGNKSETRFRPAFPNHLSTASLVYLLVYHQACSSNLRT